MDPLSRERDGRGVIRVSLVEPGVAGFPGVRGILSGSDGGIVLVEPGSSRPGRFDVAVSSTAPYALSLLAGLREARGEFSLLLLGSAGAPPPELPPVPLRAVGILPQEAGPGEVLAALRALAEGLAVGPPELLGPLLSRAAAREGPREEGLTPREIEVLAGLAAGRANKQIAYDLGISEHTVKFHTSSIYGKLGATNRAEAVAVGIRRGLLGV
jgi:DNA-binding NarL/FixJ family response regulator